MRKLMSEVLHYYDMTVIEMIMEKYGYSAKEAMDKFLKSKTHDMLEDEEMFMVEFGCPAIFDIWEAEQITGDPRNSAYIRCD